MPIATNEYHQKMVWQEKEMKASMQVPAPKPPGLKIPAGDKDGVNSRRLLFSQYPRHQISGFWLGILRNLQAFGQRPD
jgi:hypothetical protein